MHVLKTAVFSLALFAALASSAQSYFRFNTGMGLRPDAGLKVDDTKAGTAEIDTGIFLLGAAGVEFPRTINDNLLAVLRTEFAVRYQFNNISSVRNNGLVESIDDSTIEEVAGMFGIFVDFKNQTPMQFTVGGGFGLAHATIESYGESVADTVPIINLGAGISYALSDNTAFEINYNMYLSDDISDTYSWYDEDDGETYSAKVGSDLVSHNIGIGVRTLF